MLKRSIILTCLLLGACATPEQREAQRQAQMNADYNTCVNEYGFRAKSDAARNCMLQLEIARQQRYYNNAYSDPYPYHVSYGFYQFRH